MSTDWMLLITLLGGLGWMGVSRFFSDLSSGEAFLCIMIAIIASGFGAAIIFEYFSKSARERKKRIERIQELPQPLLTKSADSIELGQDEELKISVFLPDSIRMRHVHLIGSTGSGKTESVILNFLRQDIPRGLGAIIMDAKGDASFLRELRKVVPADKLFVFDLGSENSLTYNPLSIGLPYEAAQRLFSSLTWSEEYYKSKALSTLQRIFQRFFRTENRNPTLAEIASYLEDQSKFLEITQTPEYPAKLAERDFMEISGLRDQVKALTAGHLEAILSPKGKADINIEETKNGNVYYFRLQSLTSREVVSTLGKLMVNHLSYIAGICHRNEEITEVPRLTPVFLDEFASFACPEFSDLISKARSAGFALHFSHQSIGDLVQVSEGFLNQITDNSATKIVMRINDPDSAEFFARTFGTKLYQKVTQRISNVQDLDRTEVQDEGSQREAHQFRASPDLLKSLPTGMGSVMISHGIETPRGASSVFKIRFPRLYNQETFGQKHP